MAKSATTVRLNAVSALSKVEADLREIGTVRGSAQDRTAITAIQNAREALIRETSGQPRQL